MTEAQDKQASYPRPETPRLYGQEGKHQIENWRDLAPASERKDHASDKTRYQRCPDRD